MIILRTPSLSFLLNSYPPSIKSPLTISESPMLAAQPYASTQIFIFLDPSSKEADKACQGASRELV